MSKKKRILLKLSGESLGGDNGSIDPLLLKHFAGEVHEAAETGTQIGIVIGGGNIFRGLSEQASSMDRVVADKMGMLATVINSLALNDAIKKLGTDSVVLTAVEMGPFGERFNKKLAIEYLNSSKVIIIAGGTGNPFFTTDTAAVLRAVEIDADVILKGTRVDGVYDSDPEKDPNAKRFDSLSYMDVISRELKVMDITAISLAKDNDLPIIVFNAMEKGNLEQVIKGENIGTRVGK